MKARFEKLSTGSSSFLAFERRELTFPLHWHYHPEFELTLIVDSVGQRLVGDGCEEYRPGDLVLLAPNLPHSWRSTPREGEKKLHRAIVVQFREELFGERLLNVPELREVGCLLREAAAGLSFGHTATGRKVARYFAELPTLSPAKQVVTLLEALVDLATEKRYRKLSFAGRQPIVQFTRQRRIDAICQHLEDYYQDEVDYADLANRFHMEQASLCRIFKRATGRTMTEYVNELRVATAAKLLIETDDTLIDICFRVGFGNYSHFSRQFKRLKGCNPRKLRRDLSSEVGPVLYAPVELTCDVER